MKIAEFKEIPEIDKKYYRIKRMFCDRCDCEVESNDLYLKVYYREKDYQEEAFYKHFCRNCMKDAMYEMFMNNYYVSFDKYYFEKDDEWNEYDDYDNLERWGIKIEDEK